MKACDKSFAYLSDEWRAVFGLINTVIALVAFSGNLVAFMVIINTKCFRNLSTCFLSSLIMTDFLVGILVAPMHVAQLVSEAIRNNCTLNNTRRYLSTLLVGASISSIAVISYDRYLHLTRSQNYSQFMSKRKVAALITVGWAVPAAVPMLSVIGKKDWINSAVSFVYVFTCFVVIVACYTCIMKTVKKKVKEMAQNQVQCQINQRRVNYDIRAAKVVMLIIVCFIITISPSATYFCVDAIKRFLPNGIPGLKETPGEFYYTIILALAMANSGINPLIYYLRNPRFKESLVKGTKTLCPLNVFNQRSNRLSSENASQDTVAHSAQTFVI